MIPTQQPTSLKLTRRADYYEQRCVKYPDRACFHCYTEFLHALLLEATPQVTSFVPQPFRMLVGREPYIPDVYVVRDARMEVLELKPRGEFESKKEVALRAFFERYDMQFRVVSNESVLTQERLALHWLHIVQVLAQAQYQGQDTAVEEQRLFDDAKQVSSLSVGTLLGDTLDAEHYRRQLALFRLLHRHDLHCDLSEKSLDYDTEVTAWS
ncbi:hypothetical protein [Marinobacter nauticus]|uniref:hypothetical protein n=1 Tax=Marinobacter nauticus TaxID=2743 RepID=UPI000EB1FE82|nr:hypothetical protein [Marinobacter nauticus]